MTTRNVPLLLTVAILVLLAGCATNRETRKAHKKISERRAIYSQQAGDLYRYPPTYEPFEPGPPEVPAGMVPSYSPITGEVTYVPKRTGKRMAARGRKRTGKMVSSYSPLTGEFTWVPDNAR